jgi:subtilisin family serine protease
MKYRNTIHHAMRLAGVLLLLVIGAMAQGTALGQPRSVPAHQTETIIDESGAQRDIALPPAEAARAVTAAGIVEQAASSPKPRPDAPARGKPIAGQYIVVLKDGADPRSVAAIAKVSPKYLYDNVLNGFAAQLNRGQLTALQHNRQVDYIEQDMEVQAEATQTTPPWGLDRIDQRKLPLSGSFTYNRAGAGVRVYVVDSGIQTSHPDFGGRASAVYDAFGGNGQDCNGHGTHVAGTVGGARYGVAKAVYLRSVRVLDCNGSGSWSGIIAGINWIANNHIKPAVANMSISGGYNSSVNAAVTNLINRGVFTAVAAGNANQNACNYSPASAPGTLTIAASDRTDLKASFSNYGGCVDVYAPGVNIVSTYFNGTTTSMNGTSMASPHAAGVGALYKSNFGDAASSTIVSWIINSATTSVIYGNPSGTPNRLLYKGGL